MRRRGTLSASPDQYPFFAGEQELLQCALHARYVTRDEVSIVGATRAIPLGYPRQFRRPLPIEPALESYGSKFGNARLNGAQRENARIRLAGGWFGRDSRSEGDGQAYAGIQAAVPGS